MKNTPSFVQALFLLTLIGLDIFTALPVKAQESQRPATTRAAVHLSREELKAFEGVFQFSMDADRYLRFVVRNDTLTGGFVDNTNTVQLLPDTGMSFIVNDGGDRIVFRKNAAGVVNQVYLGNNVWNRVANYKPVVKKEMEHTPDQLRPFEGLYQFRNDPNRFLQFTVKGNNLVLKQLWDGSEIFFSPESELDFFAKAIPAFTLHFTKETDGTISQLLAFKRDLWVKAQLPHFTADQLKAVEPRTNTYFYNDAQSYPLQIELDKDGKVRQLVLLMTNVFSRMKE